MRRRTIGDEKSRSGALTRSRKIVDPSVGEGVSEGERSEPTASGPDKRYDKNGGWGLDLCARAPALARLFCLSTLGSIASDNE